LASFSCFTHIYIFLWIRSSTVWTAAIERRERDSPNYSLCPLPLVDIVTASHSVPLFCSSSFFFLEGLDCTRRPLSSCHGFMDQQHCCVHWYRQYNDPCLQANGCSTSGSPQCHLCSSAHLSVPRHTDISVHCIPFHSIHQDTAHMISLSLSWAWYPHGALTDSHTPTSKSDLPVAVTGAADHQLLPRVYDAWCSCMASACMQWNGMDHWHCSLQTQLVQWTCNAWGWEVAATLMEWNRARQPALSLSHTRAHRGGGDCCTSHSAKGRESRPRTWSPPLLAAQASTFPRLHPSIHTETEENMSRAARNILHRTLGSVCSLSTPRRRSSITSGPEDFRFISN
jgi:hypothetical protein